MKFAVGVWDALFGEKVEIQSTAEDGSPIRRRVTKKWLEMMQRHGTMGPAVRVHMLHPISGYSVEWWKIGTDVDAKTVSEFQDAAGDIYALTVFESGKPKVGVFRKDLWEQARKDLQRLE